MKMWIAWHMPQWLVYMCGIRIAAYATTGERSGVNVQDVRIMDAIKLFE